MKDIIVIRTYDPDGSVFHSILGALQGKNGQIIRAADLGSFSLGVCLPGSSSTTPPGVRIMN